MVESVNSSVPAALEAALGSAMVGAGGMAFSTITKAISEAQQNIQDEKTESGEE